MTTRKQPKSHGLELSLILITAMICATFYSCEARVQETKKYVSDQQLKMTQEYYEHQNSNFYQE